METILALNCGSSSIKARLYEVVQKALRPLQEIHEKSLELVLGQIDPSTLLGIGHRFVHGGKLRSSVRLTAKVMHSLESLVELAPLHNGPSLFGIQECQRYFGKNFMQVAVFDTAFFQAMPKISALYALPQELAKKYAIERYGFHGISHAYLWEQYKRATGNKRGKIITLHLGAGCSAAAIDAGRPIDTSMGFTPLEGLVMATRTGDMDPAILPYLSEKTKMSQDRVLDICNFESGLLGVSGRTSDMKMLLQLYGKHTGATLAIDLFCYRAVKYLGAYMAALGGLDAIIFSGGIGENAPKIRQLIIKQMNWHGITLDSAKNLRARSPLQKISHQKSSVDVFVIATDENHSIANEVLKELKL